MACTVNDRISDTAARVFEDAFYLSLAQGNSLDHSFEIGEHVGLEFKVGFRVSVKANFELQFTVVLSLTSVHPNFTSAHPSSTLKLN